ncbi:MAG: 16S rRNA (guanine(966)-N(2))-methyltransferase RsmD [Lachnospiraceae bacterium]|nr:16S rRNA (guanine(966)-N(2))-methyltransferase RsmD [Lachnospiraceae bacterium]
MRVIAGKYRRLTLNTIKGDNTRPTTDRIKETLFNIIRDEVDGSNFLDLFAGSGQIGIEALSRNAISVTFVDNNRKAIECINENLDKCHIKEDVTVIQGSCMTTLKRLDDKCFDIIFMDPPYRMGLEKDILSYLSDNTVIKEGGLVIIESDLDTEFEYINNLNFELIQDKKYKTNRHLFLRKL